MNLAKKLVSVAAGVALVAGWWGEEPLQLEAASQGSVARKNLRVSLHRDGVKPTESTTQ